VEIQDWDELESAVHGGWMTAEDDALARTTAEEMRLVLSDGSEEWQRRGWTILAASH
jgi:predicted RNA-binding protein associated with RNAse of E/G family